MSKRGTGQPKAAPVAPLRTVAELQGEAQAVYMTIGVKTFQRDTLSAEIAGLENRIRALDVEIRAAQAAMPAAPAAPEKKP